MAQGPPTLDSGVALTFDDVLLVPAASRDPPQPGRRLNPRHALDLAQDPRHLLRHGHGDGGAPRHRHGAGRRHRRHPPQPRARGAGAPGRAGQEIRIGHRAEPGHHPPRRHAARGPGPHGRALDLGPAGGRDAEERLRQGASRRHPHQPRRALRNQPRAARLRADDQGEAHHGEAVGRAGGRQAAAAPAPHREAAGGRRRATAASASSRSRTSRRRRSTRNASQGRRGPPARRCGDDASARTASGAPSC